MRFIKTFIQTYSHTNLQGKVIYLILLASGFISLLGSFLNGALHLGTASIVITVLSSIICFSAFAFVYRTGTYNLVANLIVAFFILVIYPSLWIINAGSHGPTPYIYIFNTILMVIILKKGALYLFMSLKVVVIFFLVFIEVSQPHLIHGYTSKSIQILDLSLTATLVIIFTFVILRLLMNAYNTRIYELSKTQAQLEKLSITDELTGIYNRRYLIQELNRQLTDEVAIPFSLIMFDIDNFKNVNDLYGHAVGDEVIKVVSQLLNSHVRPIDIVGRIGGEEYLILLMDTSESEARKRAEAIRISVSNLKWSIPSLNVTVSGGVYCPQGFETLDFILDQVDQYLYLAKKKVI